MSLPFRSQPGGRERPVGSVPSSGESDVRGPGAVPMLWTIVRCTCVRGGPPTPDYSPKAAQRAARALRLTGRTRLTGGSSLSSQSSPLGRRRTWRTRSGLTR
jgi:hypothetical protein